MDFSQSFSGTCFTVFYLLFPPLKPVFFFFFHCYCQLWAFFQGKSTLHLKPGNKAGRKDSGWFFLSLVVIYNIYTYIYGLICIDLTIIILGTGDFQERNWDWQKGRQTVTASVSKGSCSSLFYSCFIFLFPILLFYLFPQMQWETTHEH